jgi:hypothetical protein
MLRIELDETEFYKKIEKFSDHKLGRFIDKNINDFLFATRNFAIGNARGMKSEFTIRAPGILRRHLVVKKAFGQVGYFGSLSSARFSGWSEQQTGKKTKRKIKVHKKNARGASGKRKLANRFRRNSKGAENLLRTVANGTGSYQQMIAANLSRLQRERYSGAVIMPVSFGNRKPGIYNMLKSGKLRIMEIWETKQPKQNPWATDIIKRWFDTGDYKKIVDKNLGKWVG